jgi:hypothetical protein
MAKPLKTLVFCGFVVVSGAACSLLLDTSNEQQCSSDQDCTTRGGGFVGLSCQNHVCVALDGGSEAAPPVDAGPWGCLGDVQVPTPTSQNVNVIVPLVDLATKMPVMATDVVARVCAKIDVNCNSPLATTQPDANGLLHLTLAAGFDGFVLITPIIPSSDAGTDGGDPDAGSADAAPPDVFVPSFVFFNPPIENDLTYAAIVLVRESALGQIAAVEGTAIDPSLGAVFMETEDCNAQAAAGVSITLDETTTTTQGFYFKNDFPVLNAPSTDVSGYAGFVNVPLGARTIKGTLEATQQTIGTATVFTRASMISYTVMAPSP